MGRSAGHERGYRECVLLVDDDPLIQLHEALVLVGEGYDVVEAGDADEALAILASDAGAVQVLVTDVDMPGSMNGCDLARVVDARWPWIRLVVTSAHSHLSDADIPDHGRFLPKPWAPAALAAALRTAGRAN